MTPATLTTIANGIAPAIRDFVVKRFHPIERRQADADARIVALEARVRELEAEAMAAAVRR